MGPYCNKLLIVDPIINRSIICKSTPRFKEILLFLFFITPLHDNWTRFHFIFFTTSPSVLSRKWGRGCRNSINLVSGGQNEKCGHDCFSQSRYSPQSTLKKTAWNLFRRGRKKSKIRPCIIYILYKYICICRLHHYYDRFVSSLYICICIEEEEIFISTRISIH